MIVFKFLMLALRAPHSAKYLTREEYAISRCLKSAKVHVSHGILGVRLRTH